MSTVEGDPTGVTGSVSRLYNWASAGSQALGFEPPKLPETPPAPIVLDADRKHGLGGLLRGVFGRGSR